MTVGRGDSRSQSPTGRFKSDGGSKVTIEAPSPVQTGSLATFGKVWASSNTTIQRWSRERSTGTTIGADRDAAPAEFQPRMVAASGLKVGDEVPEARIRELARVPAGP